MINGNWYLHKKLSHWRLAPEQILPTRFPVDRERHNYVREVRDAIFSILHPTPLRNNPKLAAFSDNVLKNILDMHPDISETKQFLDFVSGNTVMAGTKPLAHRYAQLYQMNRSLNSLLHKFSF